VEGGFVEISCLEIGYLEIGDAEVMLQIYFHVSHVAHAPTLLFQKEGRSKIGVDTTSYYAPLVH